MRAKWLLEKDVFLEWNHEKMVEIIRAKGMDCQIVAIVPFSRDSFVEVGPDGVDRVIHKHNMPYGNDDCVVAYGSINLCHRLYQDKPWAPTAWFNQENMRCRTYYAHWGKYLLQQDYMMLPFDEFRRKKDFIFSTFGKDCVFARPDSNMKTFSGTVIPVEKFDSWVTMTADCYSPEPSALVVVARPRNIEREWRFVIRKGEVVTYSLYKMEGVQISLAEVYPEGVIPDHVGLAMEIAKHSWQPEPIYVMDICETSDGKFHLLEIGEVNCAGLYACDLEKVVDAMSAQAEEDWRDVR